MKKREMTHRLYARQHGKCAGCQTTMHMTLMTRAHRVPKRDGGKFTNENLDLLCGPCHRALDGHTAPLNPIGTPLGVRVYV